MARILIILACLGAALALVGAGCGGGDGGGSDEEASSTTIAGQAANDHGSKDVSGEDELEMEADDFYFEPTILEGTAGQTLKIDIENEGSATHTFTIDDQDVDVTIEPGDTQEVEVTFPQSGVIRFYCRFHDGQGMAGALEAEG